MSDSGLLLEQKSTFLTHVKTILTPVLYEGFRTIYEDADILNEKRQDASILPIFKVIIKKIPTWSRTLVIGETTRLKNKSNSGEYFDNLIKATFKAYLRIMTGSILISLDKKYLDFLEKFDVNDYVHNCYIHCGRVFYMSPHLFYKRYRPIDIKQHQLEAIKEIEKCIEKAFISMLPLNSVFISYLENNDKNELSLLVQINNNLENIKTGPNITNRPVVNVPQDALPIIIPNKLQITTTDGRIENISYNANEKSTLMLPIDGVLKNTKEIETVIVNIPVKDIKEDIPHDEKNDTKNEEEYQNTSNDEPSVYLSEKKAKSPEKEKILPEKAKTKSPEKEKKEILSEITPNETKQMTQELPKQSTNKPSPKKTKVPVHGTSESSSGNFIDIFNNKPKQKKQQSSELKLNII